MPFDADLAAVHAAVNATIDAYPINGLAMQAHAELDYRFQQWGHVPSTEQWAAIRDLLEHLERAASGSIEHAVYLSAIPAGAGKSASLTAFAEALMDSPRHDHVGMLIACNRVQEVYDFAKALQGYRGRVCVIVGRDRATIEDADDGVSRDVRLMGAHQQADEAQLVLTTQAALKEALKPYQGLDGGGHFGSVAQYQYRGARRSVVCWDEVVSFNRPVVLDNDTAVGLTKAMRRQSGAASKAMVKWAASLVDAEKGPCEVPDFRALGIDFGRLEEDVGSDDDLVAAAQSLSVVSGNTGWLVCEDNRGAAMVSYVPELPDSLLPITVTDASAAIGVRHGAYQQMARTKGDPAQGSAEDLRQPDAEDRPDPRIAIGLPRRHRRGEDADRDGS